MKKIIYIFLILILYTPISFATNNEVLSSQKNSLDISSFLSESGKYINEVFPDLNSQNFIDSAITGKISNEGIFKNILNIFTKEFSGTLKTLGSILVIIVIHSILKSVSDNLGNNNISQISYYVQYILIVTIVMSNFYDIIKMVTDAIQNLVGFMYSLLPILITLMVATGSIVASSLTQTILLVLIQFIGNLISNLIIPIIIIGTVLGVVSNLSDKIQVDKLSKYLKSSTIWIVGIVLTLFVSVLSLEGTMASSVDGITAKTTKAAVSTMIPVVGKILGDAVDTVIGCAAILKNAVGIYGVVVIIGICIVPIVKLIILTVTYYLASAIIQPIADKNIVKLLENIGDTFKTLLGILFAVSFMVIIGVTIVVKITNSGLMYR